MDAPEEAQTTRRQPRVAMVGLMLVVVAAVVVFHQQSPGTTPTTSKPTAPSGGQSPSQVPAIAPSSTTPEIKESTEAPPITIPVRDSKFPFNARINYNDPNSVPAKGWGDEDDLLRDEVMEEAQKRCETRYTTDDPSDFNPGIAVRILHFGSPLLPPVGVDAEGSDLNNAKRPFASVDTAPSFPQLELLSKRRKGITKRGGSAVSFPTSEYFASYFTPKTLKEGTLHTGSTSVYDNSLSFPLKEGNGKEGTKVATLLSKRTGASAAAGRWNRFWVYTVDEGGIPTCAGGPPPSTKINLPLVPQPEHYDIALMESNDIEGAVSGAKVAVDRVMYIGYGISEVQFYIRQPSLKYRTCVDLRRSTGVKNGGKGSRGSKWAPSGRSFSVSTNITSLKLGQVLDEAATTTGSNVDLLPGMVGSVTNASVSAKMCARDVGEGQYCHMCFQTYQLTCEEGAFSGSEPPRSSLPMCTAPLKSYTTVQQYRDRFRYGGWVQMQQGLCDGQHCTVATSSEQSDTSKIQGLPPGMSPSANQDLRLSFSTSNDGWIWASDACVMVVFGNVTDLLGRPLTPTSPRPLLTNRWVYGWGSSVMKQPLSNMIESRLKKALFFLPGMNPEVSPAYPTLQEEREGTGTPIFMTDIPKHLNSKGAPRKAIAKKLPGFFNYREWDRPMTFTGSGSWWSRFTMSWAGCMSIMGAPSRCAAHTQQGMGGTYSKVSKAIAPSQTAPDAMLLEFAVWRIPLFDEKQHLDQTAEMFQRLKSLYAAKGVSTPLLIYHTSPTPVSQEGHRCPAEVPYPTAASTKAAIAMDTAGLHFKLAHSVWAYDDVVGTGCAGPNPPPSCTALAKALPKAVEDIKTTVGANPFVVVVSRHHMTLPFHFGNDYCHFGIHYGSTEGMCYTGYERKGYGLENCVRKTFVDDMLPEIWFNAIASYQASTPEPTVQPDVAL